MTIEIRKLIREVLSETRGETTVLDRAEIVRTRISDEDAEQVLMAGLVELVRQEISATRSRGGSTSARSAKVAGIRRIGEEWKRQLDALYTVAGAGHRKPLADLTRDDLLFNIANREQAAAATLAEAKRLRVLHDLVAEHDVDRVGDLPTDVLREFFDGAAA